MINNIMQKDYVIIVIINMDVIKNHGNAHMINYMLLGCVKIVILIIIIKRKDKVKRTILMNLRLRKVLLMRFNPPGKIRQMYIHDTYKINTFNY
jgi:hypothetical protein